MQACQLCCVKLISRDVNAAPIDAKTSPSQPSLVYQGITISERGIAEINNGERKLFVPKEQIQSIECGFGLLAEQPLPQILLGGALSCLGLAGLWSFISSGLVALRWALGLLFFGAVGLWLCWEATRKGSYLQVNLANDSRKLRFHGKVQKAELDEFINNASRLGYTVKSGSGEK
jgi:hypothetical protein